MLLWIIQIVNEAFVMLIEVYLRVMDWQVVVGLCKTILSHYELVNIKKAHIFVEPEETRNAIFVFKLVLIVVA